MIATHGLLKASTPALDIVADGLSFYIDAGKPASYPGTGSTWYDLSGNNRHWTLNTAYNIWNSAGYFAFVGNGSNAQGAMLTNFGYAKFVTAHTLTWVSYRNGGGGGTVLHNNSAGGYSGNTIIDIGEYGLSHCFDNSGSNAVYVNPLVNNIYIHTTFTFDGVNAAKLYQNGVLAMTNASWVFAPYTSGTNPDNLYMGSRNWVENTQNIRVGLLHHHTRVLSTSEITANFNAVRNRYGL